MKINRLTSISFFFNIVFSLGAIGLFYSFYPSIVSKLSSLAFSDIKEVVSSNLDPDSSVYYSAEHFDFIGKLPQTNNFARLPEAAQSLVRTPVWDLSQKTAGIALRFRSNSTSIKLKWTLISNTYLANLSPIATKGFDLYLYENNSWNFVGVAKPQNAFSNSAILIQGMEKKEREYLLNFPLYDGLSNLELGIDQDANITQSNQQIINTAHPIIIYGTSITQGASASRPGLTYPARIQRALNTDVINLGFSGNGRFEKTVATYFVDTSPSAIFLDCLANSPADTIQKNLPILIDYIRSKNQTVPIILVESIYWDFTSIKKDDPSKFGTFSYINHQNDVLMEFYLSKKKTDNQLYYIKRTELSSSNEEITIDGIHLNDLGHALFANVFIEKLHFIKQNNQ